MRCDFNTKQATGSRTELHNATIDLVFLALPELCKADKAMSVHVANGHLLSAQVAVSRISATNDQTRLCPH